MTTVLEKGDGAHNKHRLGIPNLKSQIQNAAELETRGTPI
jgi:hypothetical protein